MNLIWNDYGRGLMAKGDKGTWRIEPSDGWWVLTLQAPFTRGMLPKGKFVESVRAGQYAQEYEDGQTLTPASEKQ